MQMLAHIRYGPDAWLMQFAEAADENAFIKSRAIIDCLEMTPPEGLREWTISYTTVLLEYDKNCCPDVAPTYLLDNDSFSPQQEREIKIIPVRYGGDDLLRVAEHCFMSMDQVVALHSAAIYRVHALGFAPGFGYLGGLDQRLHTPRLSTPRATIPAGAVAIGGGQTAVYPLPTPGGWNLIGHTAQVMFDSAAPLSSAFFLHAGDRVRFEPI
jgi:inhibitor of KinA